MNMKQFKKRMQDIEKQADEQLTALAEQVRQEVVKPYCDKYKLKFVQGNGTYLFYNDDSDREPPKHIADILWHKTLNEYRGLFQYMQDYDGRNSK